MSALLTISERQKSLLQSLLYSQSGLTVDELSQALSISRNAVNQHLASLEGYGFIESATMSSTGGRPSRRYSLTDKGRELFPRHYALFANLLIRLLQDKLGQDKLKGYLVELGEQMAGEFLGRLRDKKNLADKVEELSKVMHELGYEAVAGQSSDGLPEIVASNCVFHQLAGEYNTVCELDLALITAILGDVEVDHRECMVRGGACCRFVVSAGS